MIVLITGASGFLGSAICLEQLSAGHEVIAVSRSSAPPGFQGRWVLVGDYVSHDWSDLVGETDVIIHAAGEADPHATSEAFASELEIARVLSAAIADAPRPAGVVLLGTARIRQDMASRNGGPGEYERSKWAVETTFRAALQPSGKWLCILRLGSVYDKRRGSLHRLARLIRKAPLLPVPAVSGEHWTLHSSNMTSAVSHCVLRGPDGLFLVVDPAPMPTPELLRHIRDCTGTNCLLVAIPGLLAKPLAWLSGHVPINWFRRAAGFLAAKPRDHAPFLSACTDWEPPLSQKEGINRVFCNGEGRSGH